MLLLALLSVSLLASAQTVNDYKYVVVPVKFNAFKKPDQYRLNSMTKSVLEKYGFTVFFDDASLPSELRNLSCSKLFADLEDDKGTFVTRLTIVLKDCSGNVLFKTEEGTSREKEYELAYNLAFRAAAKSFDQLQYSYSGKGYELGKGQATPEPAKTASPAPASSSAAATPTQASGSVTTLGTLYAQPIENGFQLVDSSPKVVLKIYKTSTPDVYMAEKGSRNGTFRKFGNSWVLEYYEAGKLVSETYEIKF